MATAPRKIAANNCGLHSGVVAAGISSAHG
jgi:hypothetical protein